MPGTASSYGVIPRDVAYGYAYDAGFRGSDADTIVAIAQAESGFRPNPPDNPNHYGILQFAAPTIRNLTVNGRHGTIADALDPARAFQYAYQLFTERGFRDWETYTTSDPRKSYKQYLGGYVGTPSGGPPSPGDIAGGVGSALGIPSAGDIGGAIGTTAYNLGRSALPYVVITAGLIVTGVLFLREIGAKASPLGMAASAVKGRKS